MQRFEVMPSEMAQPGEQRNRMIVRGDRAFPEAHDRFAKKRILVILGHPRRDSFCGAIASTYANSARNGGAAVRELALGELDFDPVLRAPTGKQQPLEPDLQMAQTAILWATHLVFVYPNWWGTMPALMKGFLDRAITSGFAFQYRPNSLLVDQLLKSRSAHLIVTMDTPSWYYRWIFKMPGHEQMKRTILGFCGIKSVQITDIASVRQSTAKQRQQWLKKVERAALQTCR